MAKVLITGLANSGKTTLLQTLNDVLVIAVDGKKYPFKQPHKNVSEFDSVDALITTTEDSLTAYETKYDGLPKTIVFDTVSRVASIIVDNCSRRYSGFDVWNNVNKEIKKFTDYIELVSNSGINTIIVAHCIYDQESGRYVEVTQGNFAKIGGFLSIVDYALHVEAGKLARTVYHKNPFHLSRSLLPDIAEKELVKDFNLQTYIDKINSTTADTEAFSL